MAVAEKSWLRSGGGVIECRQAWTVPERQHYGGKARAPGKVF
jgi:hypothetical protein